MTKEEEKVISKLEEMDKKLLEYYDRFGEHYPLFVPTNNPFEVVDNINKCLKTNKKIDISKLQKNDLDSDNIY